MSGSKRVKLYTYQHETNEEIIESYPAESWEDFLIIHVAPHVTQADAAALQANIKESGKWHDKHVIIMPESMNIEFYGITDSRPVDEQVHRVGDAPQHTINDSSLHVPGEGTQDGPS